MKTEYYNPSSLELYFADAIQELKGEIEKKLDGNKIVSVKNKLQKDNPVLHFKVEDKDGDQHEIVLKMIQKPDEEY